MTLALAARARLRTGTTLAGAVGLALAALALPAGAVDDTPVGDALTKARASDGRYISWREHIIDDVASSGEAISGSDGLVLADLDKDGHADIVSVHESDTQYDGTPDGHVRIAFGSADPHVWENVTLASGTEAAAPEDASIADLNGDGWLDVIVASELAHLIYLQNPGTDVRTTRWARLVIPQTEGRGSWIRVFFGDFNGDGRPEVAAPNKGAQNPDRNNISPTAISVFEVKGDPLEADSWVEHELGRYGVPQNAEPVDLDGDGDLDIIGGVRFPGQLIFFENVGEGGAIAFKAHPVEVSDGVRVGGFNLDYADMNGDGRLDIIGSSSRGMAWIEQPDEPGAVWTYHYIGYFWPDSETGLAVADINGDGRDDVILGSYSRGPRDRDGAQVDRNDALGRIGWFENPGDGPGAEDGGWVRHDISRRKRGMFDKFIARDLDGDGDLDFLGTRGNSQPYDGVFWLEQVRTDEPVKSFTRARAEDSVEMPMPTKLPPGAQ